MTISDGGLAQALLKYDELMLGKTGNLADRITAMRGAVDAATRYEIAQLPLGMRDTRPVHSGPDRRTAAVGHVAAAPFTMSAKHRPGAAEREEIANARAQTQAALRRPHPARDGFDK